MPDVDPEEGVTAIKDGITVEKSFEPDDFPVPAIAFAISSDREESVTVRLVDTVPDDIAPENVGFHPKHGAEFWDVDGDAIVFEREFSAGEEYTTVYGLRGSDADVPAKFLSEPSIESVDPSLDGDEAEDPAAVDAAVAAVEDDSNAVPAIERIENGSETGAEDPDGEIVPSDTDHGRASDSEVAAATRAGGTDVLSTLAAEIEAADPDDPAVAELRDALGVDLTRATVEARIEHLQSAVADLEAYTDALEAFLDENGDAQGLLEDLRDEYEGTTTRLDEVESLAEDAHESAESIDDRLDSEIDELRAEVERMESDIEAFSDELSAVVEMRDRLTRALGGLTAEGTIDDGGDDPVGNDGDGSIEDAVDPDGSPAPDAESSDGASDDPSDDAAAIPEGETDADDPSDTEGGDDADGRDGE
jgi:hypothetical protein